MHTHIHTYLEICDIPRPKLLCPRMPPLSQPTAHAQYTHQACEQAQLEVEQGPENE